MAYLAFDALGPTQQKVVALVAPMGRLSPLESAVALLQRDELSSSRGRGWLAIALGSLSGIKGNATLADQREEALRPVVALARNDCVSMPAREITDFLSAGFTTGQHRTMLASIRMASLNGPRHA